MSRPTTTMDLRFPTPAHHRVLDEIVTELTADADVCGIMVIGSLARGTARADSDLDLVIVGTAECQHPWRTRPHPVPVDLNVRTADQWRAHCAPDRVGDLAHPAGVADRVRGILRAPPAEALRRQLDLVAELEPRLGRAEGEGSQE